MSDIITAEVKQLGKVGSLIGLCIGALLTLAYASFQAGTPIDMSIYIGIIIFFMMLVAIQILYFIQYIIEKDQARKDQLALSQVQNIRVQPELKKLELKAEIAKLELERTQLEVNGG